MNDMTHSRQFRAIEQSMQSINLFIVNIVFVLYICKQRGKRSDFTLALSIVGIFCIRFTEGVSVMKCLVLAQSHPMSI